MFSEIGNVQCLFPKFVNILALTATATMETFNSISKSLLLNNPILVGLPPNRATLSRNAQALMNYVINWLRN